MGQGQLQFLQCGRVARILLTVIHRQKNCCETTLATHQQTLHSVHRDMSSVPSLWVLTLAPGVHQAQWSSVQCDGGLGVCEQSFRLVNSLNELANYYTHAYDMIVKWKAYGPKRIQPCVVVLNKTLPMSVWTQNTKCRSAHLRDLMRELITTLHQRIDEDRRRPRQPAVTCDRKRINDGKNEESLFAKTG